MTTTSDWSRLTVPAGDVIVSSKGGLSAGAADVARTNTTSILIGNNILGVPATVQFDILLSTDGVSDGVWQITKGWGQSSHVDVYNINNYANPVMIATVDDVELQDRPTTFVISGASESTSGPLAAGSPGPRKVFAIYCPWWSVTMSKWSAPYAIDNPVQLYNTLNPADAARQVDSASANGIEGFVSSWQGKEHFADAALRLVLDAANQRPGFTVAAYLESGVANQGHTYNQPPDPAYLRQWIRDVVQNYGSNPAYLKMNGKPVIFIYRARYFTPDIWKSQVFDPLRAEGIDPFYIGDYVSWDHVAPLPEYLAVFDGLHSYNPSVYSTIDSQAIYNCFSINSMATRTYHLLNDPGAPRKVWMGTAVPGFDTTHLYNPGLLIPRDSGNFYRSMWDTNLATYPDWMLVTTWNDFGENTHVQESVTYGTQYLDLTREYASAYRAAPAISELSPSGMINSSAITVSAVFSGTSAGIDLSSVNVHLDGIHTNGCSVTSTGVSCPVEGLIEGDHSFTVSVADLNGSSGYAQDAFYVDTQAPVVASIQPEGVIDTSSTTISACIEDCGCGVDAESATVVLDGAGLTGCTSDGATVSCPVTDLAEGGHSVNVSVADKACNSGNASSSFRVDAAPPSIASVEPAGVIASDATTITVSFQEAGSEVDTGASNIELDHTAVSGCTFTATTISCPVNGLPQGVHTIGGRIFDRTGHYGDVTGSFTSNLPGKPDLELEASSSEPYWYRGKLWVGFTITNTGNNTAFNVSVISNLSTDGVTNVTVLPKGVATRIHPGQSVVKEYKFSVPAGTSSFNTAWTLTATDKSGLKTFTYNYPMHAVYVPAGN
jgi:hypothetical protein